MLVGQFCIYTISACLLLNWTISSFKIIYIIALQLYGYSLNKGVSSDSAGTFSTTTKPNTVKERKVVTPSDNLSPPFAGRMYDTEARMLSK